MLPGGAGPEDYDDEEPSGWRWLRYVGYAVAFFLLMGLLISTLQTRGSNLQAQTDTLAVPPKICGYGHVAVRLLAAHPTRDSGSTNQTFCIAGYKP